MDFIGSTISVPVDCSQSGMTTSASTNDGITSSRPIQGYRKSRRHSLAVNRPYELIEYSLEENFGSLCFDQQSTSQSSMETAGSGISESKKYTIPLSDLAGLMLPPKIVGGATRSKSAKQPSSYCSSSYQRRGSCCF